MNSKDEWVKVKGANNLEIKQSSERDNIVFRINGPKNIAVHHYHNDYEHWVSRKRYVMPTKLVEVLV